MFFITVAGNLTEEEDEEELDPEGFAEEESESDDESYVEVVPKKAAASRPSLVGNRSSSRKTRSSTSTGRTGASLDSRSDIRTNNGTVMLPYVTFPYESFTQQGRVMIQVIKIHSLSGCVNSELGYSARVAEGNSDILIEFHKNDSVIEFYKQGNRYLNPRSSVYCSELQHGHDYAMSTATRNFTEYPQQTMRVPSLNHPIRDILRDEIRPYIYEFRAKDGKRIYAENSVLFIYAELEVPDYKRDRAATMSLVSDSFDDTPSYYPKTDPSPPKSPRGGQRLKHFSSSGAKGTSRAKKRHAPPSVASVTDSLSSMSVDDVDKKMAAPVQVPSTVFNHNSRAQVAAPHQTSSVPDQAVLQQQQQMLNEQALQDQQIQFNRQAEMMALQRQQLQQQQQQVMRQRQYEEQMAAERARLEGLARIAEQRRNEVSNREDVRRLLAQTETRLADHVQQQQVTDTDEEEEDSDLLSYFNGESL